MAIPPTQSTHSTISAPCSPLTCRWIVSRNVITPFTTVSGTEGQEGPSIPSTLMPDADFLGSRHAGDIAHAVAYRVRAHPRNHCVEGSREDGNTADPQDPL